MTIEDVVKVLAFTHLHPETYIRTIVLIYAHEGKPIYPVFEYKGKPTMVIDLFHATCPIRRKNLYKQIQSFYENDEDLAFFTLRTLRLRLEKFDIEPEIMEGLKALMKE